MISRFGWAWRQITGRFWFQVSLYALGAVAAVLLADFGAPLMPTTIVDSMVEGAGRELLKILASSMLVVATFSLGAMVQAYAAAASIATPRATRILITDPKSQRVLSTFLGAFVFAMVALLFQGFGYYNPAGDAVLLVATALVVVVVIATLFGWLDHLANLVRLGETIRKIELRASKVMEARLKAPWLGGVSALDQAETNWPVETRDTGYVQHLDVPKLQTIAERAGGFVSVVRCPGALADPSGPLARLSWEASDADRDEIRAAFTLDHERSFDQDVRYSLVVLCEVASRALSPGVNDPGTAISIIGTQQRLLTQWAQGLDRSTDPPPCPRVRVPALATADLFDDAFQPITRDGANVVEVGVRLQKALRTLSRLGAPDFATAARTISRKALRHAAEALPLAEDLVALQTVAAEFGTTVDT